MSNLGFQTVYQCFNAEEDVVCERAFLPDPEDLREYQESQTPLLSLESQKPLSDFDLLAFSISFENDFPNILTLLDLARVPLESRHRGESDPLVIGGGVAVLHQSRTHQRFFRPLHPRRGRRGHQRILGCLSTGPFREGGEGKGQSPPES